MTSSHTSPPGHIPLEQSLIEHPSDFPIKVMGPMYGGSATTVIKVVRLYDPGFHEERLERCPSSSGNYLGLTAIVHATSHKQLDAFYQALTSHPMIKIIL